MKSGKCPKCNSRQIYKNSSVSPRSNLVINFFRQARLVDYICTECGYLEVIYRKNRKLKID